MKDDDSYDEPFVNGGLDDSSSLDEVRSRVLESVGPEYGAGVLYGMGLNQGLLDGLRVARGFDLSTQNGPSLTGGPIQMVFKPGGLDAGDCFAGTLHESLEVELHVDRYPTPRDPICWATAGYAAGWYTALLGEPYLVRETECAACGGPNCAFEARPVDNWLSEGDAWARALLPYLDFERMRDGALEKLDEIEGCGSEGSMMGGFDPMSPAVHVWGAVMVLPYSGREDSEAALDAIRDDLGPRQLQVVIVDVTGADIDGLEARGLLQLIDKLSSLGLETVLVGMPDDAADTYLQPGSCMALPLRVPDITAGITLAFQICQPNSKPS